MRALLLAGLLPALTSLGVLFLVEVVDHFALVLRPLVRLGHLVQQAGHLLAYKPRLKRLYKPSASQLVVQVHVQVVLLFSLLALAFRPGDNDTLRERSKN